MATEIRYPDPVGKSEIRMYPFDLTNDLPSGVTVSATVVATHTPPRGESATPTVAVSSPNVNVTLGPLAVTGIHYLDILATLSDSEKVAVRMIIPVMW